MSYADTGGKNVEITGLLAAWRAGEETALARLMEAVHGHLRELARRQFARERPDHTLQPTALINELFLRLQHELDISWGDRNHFFAVAAHIMRRILVDHARKKQALCRGGHDVTLHADEQMLPGVGRQGIEILALDTALKGLARVDAMQHQVVVMRFFGGLTVAETASVMAVTERTVHRKWAAARLWLLGQLREV